VLWLSEEQFPNKEKDIGQSVLNFCKYGLEIKYYKTNIRSYTKLIPSLKAYPNDIIITVDDDIYYDEKLIERLYTTYLKSSEKNIVADRCHKVAVYGKKIKPYQQWLKCIPPQNSSFLNFQTGVGGVLYPPRSLSPEVLKEEIFFSIAPTTDDVWFWAMAVLNGTKILVAENSTRHLTYVNPERELGLNDDATLFSVNKNSECGNDAQLKKILAVYPQILDKIVS
jgi:hypothetical protein